MNARAFQWESRAREEAQLLEEQGVHTGLSFPPSGTEGGVGQRTPDVGACRFLFLQEGIFVLPEHNIALSTLRRLSECRVRLGSEGGCS